MTFEKISRTFGFFMLLAGNMVPLYGVLAWGWDVFSIFFLYWAENAIIGIYTLMMMGANAAQRGILAFIASLFAMGFFVVHYGVFCLAHIAILTEIFGKEHLLHKNFQPQDLIPLLLSPKIQGFYLAMLGLAVAQAFNCFHAYITKYIKAKRPEEIMFSPYGRIVVLHISILVGGLIAQSLGQPIGALVVLIALKTLYDMSVIKMRTGEDALKVEVQQ